MSKTFTGRGTITVDGEEHPCAYHLETYVDRHMKSGSGHLEAAPNVIWATFTGGKAVVKMEDGRTFPIIIEGGMDGGTTPFLLAGAISDPA